MARYTSLGTKIADNWTEEYIEQVLAVEAEKGRAICGAYGKRKGTPCPNRPLEGSGRCKYHGGASTGPQDTSSMEGNTRTVTLGEKATGLKNRLYEQIYGTKPVFDDPLIRITRMQEISMGIVFNYIEKNLENLTIEDINKITTYLEKLANTDLRLHDSIQREKEQIKKTPLSPEELLEMNPTERLKYINNLLLISTLSDDQELKAYYEVLSKGLKAEGDLTLKAEEQNSNDDYEDDIDDSIDGVDDDGSIETI